MSLRSIRQHAPAPDYRIGNPYEPIEAASEPEPCSCDEAVFLRERLFQLREENQALRAEVRRWRDDAFARGKTEPPLPEP